MDDRYQGCSMCTANPKDSQLLPSLAIPTAQTFRHPHQCVDSVNGDGREGRKENIKWLLSPPKILLF